MNQRCNNSNDKKYGKLNEDGSFSIANINTFLYDVKIKGENIEFHSDPPEVFQLFFDTEKFSKPASPAAGIAAMSSGSLEERIEQYNIRSEN